MNSDRSHVLVPTMMGLATSKSKLRIKDHGYEMCETNHERSLTAKGSSKALALYPSSQFILCEDQFFWSEVKVSCIPTTLDGR